MNRFILVVIKLIVICNIVTAISDRHDDFGEKVKNKRRQLIRTPAKNVKKTSLLERLLAVKNDFENSEEDSRSIDYRPDKNEEDHIPTREELIKKLKFDLQPKASLSNHTLVIDGLSVLTNQNHPPSSVKNPLSLNTNLLSQLGSFLPGGGPNDNVDDIHAELQGMLFGEDEVEGDVADDKDLENYNIAAKQEPAYENSTFSEDEENVTMYDLFDYLDYTEETDVGDESDDQDMLHDSEDDEDKNDEEDSMEDQDQAVEESIRYKQRIPINFLNMSSSSLPLVGERRQGSFVRFPNRKIQNSNKMSLKTRMRNKQRILQQQLQQEEIQSRIINRKPTRNRYKSDLQQSNVAYGFDYEGKDSLINSSIDL